MATRMQQRRGTAATWTAANPILAAGEIGFEIDTNKFKIGDGSNRWANLTYFTADAAAAIEELIGGAPGLLDTLNELAAAINDDPNFFATVATNLSNHEADTTNVHGISNTADLATKSYADQAEADAISTASSDATSKANAAQAAAIAAAAADATTKANAAKSGAEVTAAAALSSHEADTTNVHGIADTAALATKTYADNAASSAQAAAINTAAADATTKADAAKDYADTQIAALDSDDIEEGSSNLYHTTARARQSISGGTGLDYDSATGIMDIDGTVTTNSGTQVLSNKTISYADNTITVQVSNVSDITASAAEINVLDGITSSTAELNILDGVLATATEINTLQGIDSNIQDQIDLKANLAGASFTGAVTSTSTITTTNSTPATSTTSGALVATGGIGVGGNAYVGGNLVVSGNLEINGTTTTVSTQDLTVSDPIIYIGESNTANVIDLGFVATFDDGAEQHTGLVRDASAGKWKLFKGVLDHPTTTVNFDQGYLDDLAVGGLSANSLTVGDVSNDEISYLNGVTSSIQTQIDSKVAKAGDTMTGALTLSGAPTTDLHAATKLYVDTVSTTKADAANLAAQTFTVNEINALDSDDIEEGSVNKYHTTARVRESISGDTGLDYNSTTGVMSIDSTVVTKDDQQTLTLKTLTSPVFTGVPVAPTAALGTNTMQVATTAFVDAAIEALASRNLVLDGGGV